VRIAALATYVPEGRIDAEEIIRAAGGSPTEARVFRRLFGLDQVSVACRKECLHNHFRRVIADLSAASLGERPDTLIHVRGRPLKQASERLPLDHLRREHWLFSQVERHYEIDQTNCSGLFWALDFARILLEAGEMRCAVILAGDHHSDLRLGDRYLPGSTLMGDAFCGLLLDGSSAGIQIGALALHSHPEFSFGYAGDMEQMGAFFAAHGRIVRSALNEIGFDWGAGTPLLPHNVNRLAWQVFCRETGMAMERIRLGLLPDIGHCYTCDPFLLLDAELRWRATDQSSPDLTLVSVGMGGFVGACRLVDVVRVANPVHCLQRSASHVGEPYTVSEFPR
jgi:3-oxoacyl-[acyl-carrier-protein] synthase-3